MHICLLGRANKQRRSNLRLVCACIRICYYYGMAFVFILCWHFKINVLIKLHSTICGNKMPTRCNWGFYYKSYCFLNMFRAPLCPLSGAQEYYAVVAACGISCCGFQVAGLVLCSILQTGHVTLSSATDQKLENHSTKCHRQQPLYNTLELLMMDIVVPETCWASIKICNKKTLLHLVGILFPHISTYKYTNFNNARGKFGIQLDQTKIKTITILRRSSQLCYG